MSSALVERCSEDATQSTLDGCAASVREGSPVRSSASTVRHLAAKWPKDEWDQNTRTRSLLVPDHLAVLVDGRALSMILLRPLRVELRDLGPVG